VDQALVLNIENNMCLHPNGDLNLVRIIAKLNEQQIETFIPSVANLGIPTEKRILEDRPDPSSCVPLSPHFFGRLKRNWF